MLTLAAMPIALCLALGAWLGLCTTLMASPPEDGDDREFQITMVVGWLAISLLTYFLIAWAVFAVAGHKFVWLTGAAEYFFLASVAVYGMRTWIKVTEHHALALLMGLERIAAFIALVALLGGLVLEWGII